MGMIGGMKGFAVSSMVPEVVITEEIAVALLENLRRGVRWWRKHLSSLWADPDNIQIVWNSQTGVVSQDIHLAVVQVVQNFNDRPGWENFAAVHTVDTLGREVCLISWEAIQRQGGSIIGPLGVCEAISHELLECMVDPDCQAKEVLPNGMLTSREVADWVQGTGYQEPTSPNVTVANCVGPRFFVAGETGALDIRSDVTTGAVTTAFEETSQGYHNVIDPSSGAVSFVYGEQVTDAKKMLLEEQGVRGGLWQQRNTVAA